MEISLFRTRLRIDGVMPERALLKLRRAGIALYRVKKVQKTQILLEVKKKDIEKVFAIYPKVCYNSSGYSPYTATVLGDIGLAKAFGFIKNRIGLIVGGLAFCALTLFADTLVFSVEVVGTRAYERDVKCILAKYGVKPFSKYGERDVDEICSEILRLDGVEYCSVQKSGLRVAVDIRLAKFQVPTLTIGDMTAKRSGEIRNITVLCGTPLKKVGDTVVLGERMVGGYFQTESGTQKTVAPIARAEIACVYECAFAVETEEQAFAAAYLELGLNENDEIENTEIAQTENGYIVKIAYTVIETINF
jgi:similar to stage IV sporulation protein